MSFLCIVQQKAHVLEDKTPPFLLHSSLYRRSGILCKYFFSNIMQGMYKSDQKYVIRDNLWEVEGEKAWGSILGASNGRGVSPVFKRTWQEKQIKHQFGMLLLTDYLHLPFFFPCTTMQLMKLTRWQEQYPTTSIPMLVCSQVKVVMLR